jgi:hypothetical protein
MMPRQRRKTTLKNVQKYWGHSVSMWVAVFASFALTFELWFVILAVWHMLQFWGQLALFLGTVLVVVIFGYRDSLPNKGMIKRKKIKVKSKNALNMGD